ncbi:MAG: hypothetical protein ABJA78_10465 [Ferruginibacter sp.]
MKYLFTFLTFMIAVNFSNAQFAKLKMVDEIASYADASTQVLVITDMLRGGNFFLYSGSDNPDNGMIFIDAIKRKWLRQTDGNGVINSRWYGIKNGIPGRADVQNDMWDKLQLAQYYIWQHKTNYTTLLIPNDDGSYPYIYLSKTDTIKNPINITGTGNFDLPYSSLIWYNQTVGFYVPALQENGDANLLTLKNLRLNQYVNTFSDTVHLIKTLSFFNFENISITGASGDGIHVIAAGNRIGNAGRSVMTNVQVTACNNGVYLEGRDANIIESLNCSYVSNRRWGYWDNSLLGTSNYSGHFSNNGKVAGHETAVKYGGIYYRCLANTGITGKRPDLYPALWQAVTQMGDGLWDATKKYFSGGTYYVSNINARTTFYSPYTEPFQPPAILNQSSHSIDGHQGSGVNDDSGVSENIYGNFKIISSNFIIPAFKDSSHSRLIGLGTVRPQPDAVVTIHANSTTSHVNDALALRSDTTSVWLRGINSTSASGYIGYSADTWIVYAGNVSVHTTSPTEFRPSYDNVTDLGSASFSWKNIYGGINHCDKLIISTGSNASLGTGTLINGAVTINTALVTGKSKIFVTLIDCTNCGTLYTGTITAGKSFVVHSTNVSDRSNFNWWIIN